MTATLVRASRLERSRALPGDGLIPNPIGVLTHAVTVAGTPREVWPWLVQMGAGSRAGWYSYDFLDNGGTPSASRIDPELQHIAIGTVFPALPGVTDGFHVVQFDPERFLVLSWRGPDGACLVTWAFVLEDAGLSWTRLIVRARAGADYRFHGLPARMSMVVARLVHFVMQRRQLVGIAQRVQDMRRAS